MSNARLTLDSPSAEEISAVLVLFKALEKVVIELSEFFDKLPWDYDWDSHARRIRCFASNLKIVQINDKKGYSMGLGNFVGFLLKNAKALEKLTLDFGGPDNEFAYMELSDMPRCSEHVVVEVAGTRCPNI